jgi:hypothetical protein
MGIKLYLHFWWECACEAWHGSLSMANGLSDNFRWGDTGSKCRVVGANEGSAIVHRRRYRIHPFHRSLLAAFGVDHGLEPGTCRPGGAKLPPSPLLRSGAHTPRYLSTH